ncbi:ATP-binding protein [Oleiagrimonas sp. C23AA]|uniref:ATP-binding protein n=1 Tax=Oleiagrimonas sp. C23AA TaxID=2719047 RepID=UPI0014205144|nr:ATP-binding protein [Oleiagrimonas sp. C23AA]NII09941.1 PAS domain-containing protein [Oleiagrimonas sp. C23AA]
MALRWRLVGLLLVVSVSVALPYLVTRDSTNSAMKARTWVAHTAEVKSVVYRVLFHVRDMEAAVYSSINDFGDAKFMQFRLQNDAREVPDLLNNLRNLTVDNSSQQVRIGSFEAVVRGRMKLLAEAADFARKGDVKRAYAALSDGQKMFHFRRLGADIVQTEEQLMTERSASATERTHRLHFVQAVTTAAQLVLLFIVVVVSERQISRRLLAERETREAVARAQSIVQAVREPIAVLDDELCTVSVNAAFVELYGHDPAREGSRHLSEVGEGAWSDKALLQRLTDVMARSRELWDFDLEQTTQDGVDRHVVINARQMELPERTHAVLLLTVSDVSARRMAEEQVFELNRQLEGKIEQISDVNRELEAFSYSVSHDLRAPLRHIAGFSDKLARHLGDSADERSAHYLDIIGDAARRMASLIDDLLVYSRLGRGAMRMQSVDMQSLAEEARSLTTSNIGERDIEWRIQPLPVVVGDENMLRTVWQNLIGNAVKYTGQREHAIIEITAERSSRGDYLFSVKDNGAGFDMRFVNKLFGVFQRLHKTSEFTGSGIGLANVRRIVARHGGRTWAEGEPDKGATFHFSLPASASADAQS